MGVRDDSLVVRKLAQGLLFLRQEWSRSYNSSQAHRLCCRNDLRWVYR